MDLTSASRATADVRAARGVYGTLLTILVLVSGALLTWLTWRANINADKAGAEAELSLQAADIEAEIRDRLGASEALLRAGAGVVNTFWPVTREQWRQFVAQLQLASVYPDIQGVGFAVRIQNREQLERWTRELKAVGPNGLDQWSSQGAGLPETAIVFLEPLNERNLRAIGYDMTTELQRQRAMERARDTSTAALSGKVVLVQDAREGTRGAGFLLYVPVYATADAPSDVAERRNSLRGFVYSPFRAEHFFESALADVLSGVVVEVFDGPRAGSDTLIYRNAEPTSDADLVDVRRMPIGGHEWTLRVSMLQAANAKVNSGALLTALAGIATTLLLAWIVQVLGVSRQRLHERMQADMALAQRDQQASQILENALDAYIAIDLNDRVVEWNRQAAALFGWSAREAIGRKLTDTIVPPDLRQRHAEAISSFERRPEHALLGQRLEMPARCRDGTELTIELSIVHISTAAGPRFFASLRNITQERRQAQQIRILNETLEQRVAERTTQLEVANRELSSVNRDLEAFTYSVSHDLRAPLRAIDGHILRLLEHSGELSEKQRHHAAATRRNLARMNQLIDDLLNLAMVGRRPLEKQRISLWEIVRQILNELQASPSVVYQVSPDELGEVQADPALLKQALTNLLSNALKFSRAASPPVITIGSNYRSGERVYFVRDNGVGFDMQYAEKLFGVFERMHNAGEFEGTGVGLAIVKQIIERHGGRVWAEATPDSGATFYFTLP
jgi:PAS domain S-box-containing protein